MGAPAKLDGKAVEGVKILLGGRIGENPEVGAALGAAQRGARCPANPSCLLVGLTASPPLPLGPPLQLAKEFERGIPVDESVLLPRLRQLLISEFGATPKAAPAAAPATAAAPAAAGASA